MPDERNLVRIGVARIQQAQSKPMGMQGLASLEEVRAFGQFFTGAELFEWVQVFRFPKV